MYTLTILTTPPLQWSEPEITSLGDEHSSVNGEVPNMTVVVDNARGQHTVPVTASRILRARAELTNGDSVLFSGAVQAVSIGQEITLELEA